MAISLMRRVNRPAGSSAKGISEPKGTSGCFAGARGQRIDIDTVEMECVWAQQFETGGHGNMITDRIVEVNSHLASLDVIVRVHELTLTPMTDPSTARPEGRRDVPHQSARPGRKASGEVNRIPASAFAPVRWRAFRRLQLVLNFQRRRLGLGGSRACTGIKGESGSRFTYRQHPWCLLQSS